MHLFIGNHNLLVRYDCGCVGFRPALDGNAILIKACEADSDELEIFERNQKGKKFLPLPRDVENAFFDTLLKKVCAGYRLDEVRQILRTVG
jgi:hypothetical protein